MDEVSFSSTEAAHLLAISEEEADRLAYPDSRVPLEAVHDRAGAMTLELARELAHTREEVGRLSG